MKWTLEQQQRCNGSKKQRETLLGRGNLSEEDAKRLAEINAQLQQIIRPEAFARMVAAGGGYLIGMDGASLVGPDGRSLIGMDGASMVAAGGGKLADRTGAR